MNSNQQEKPSGKKEGSGRERKRRHEALMGTWWIGSGKRVNHMRRCKVYRFWEGFYCKGI